MRDKHILDEVWMIKHESALRPKTKIGDISIFASDLQQEIERVAAKGEQMAAG